MEMRSETHNMALSTRADPMASVAMVKPASVPSTPFDVSSRYPTPAPPAAPPGITWATADVASTMRTSLNSPGFTPGNNVRVSRA